MVGWQKQLAFITRRSEHFVQRLFAEGHAIEVSNGQPVHFSAANKYLHV